MFRIVIIGRRPSLLRGVQGVYTVYTNHVHFFTIDKYTIDTSSFTRRINHIIS